MTFLSDEQRGIHDTRAGYICVQEDSWAEEYRDEHTYTQKSLVVKVRSRRDMTAEGSRNTILKSSFTSEAEVNTDRVHSAGYMDLG